MSSPAPHAGCYAEMTVISPISAGQGIAARTFRPILLGPAMLYRRRSDDRWRVDVSRDGRLLPSASPDTQALQAELLTRRRGGRLCRVAAALICPEAASASRAGGGRKPAAGRGPERGTAGRGEREVRREIGTVEKQIARLDAEKRRHHEALLVATDPAEAVRLHEQMTKAAADLATAEERWLALQEEQSQLADGQS